MALSLISAISRWRKADRAQLQLDALLVAANAEAPLFSRNAWLVELGFWLRRDKARFAGASDDRDQPRSSARLRYLLQVLERNAELRQNVAATLQSIFRDLDSVSLLCDTGVPQHASFWSELRERVVLRLIPATPNTREWGTLLTQLFPARRDLIWMQSIDAGTWQRACALFDAKVQAPPATEADGDIVNSMRFLVTQVRASALSSAIRSRMDVVDFAQSPFLPLERALDALLQGDAAEGADEGLHAQRLNVFRGLIEACRRAALEVFDHLEDNGVSIDIEFRVEGILARLGRLELLLEVWLRHQVAAESQRVLVELVRTHQASLSIADLWRQSFARLARKVVDRSAKTGEHYITRNGAEYRAMLLAAAGGGLLTAITVYMKFFITSAHLPRLFESLLSSLNYAASFVVLQLLGLTLATKQPAMTAPALAARIDHLGGPGGMDAFVEETVNLLRSQAVAVFGNVALVVPGCMALEWLANAALGTTLITPAKAQATIASFSIVGPTPLYAAMTGVLLWMSSLIAGWADNWFVYRRIGDVIAHHRRLRLVLGERRAAAWAAYWRAHIMGFAGNISLGFLLGMTPFLGDLIALPLEVRHVTLSAGGIASAVAVLGSDVLSTRAFWYAVLGVLSMAILNVAVSFALAFQLALRSRNLTARERRQVYGSVLRTVVRRPQNLIVIPRARLRQPG